MEHQQQQLQENTNSSSSKSSYLCRQSSTRWNPTTDQIRILKELYYKNGVRSPNAEQIQTICARLRQYGKIEGKNVFYWFQNHKARERQKKRFTVDIGVQRGWKREDSFPTKYCNTGFSSPSSSYSPEIAGVGQMGSSSGYGTGGAGNMVEADQAPHMQTLQLFPVHAEEEDHVGEHSNGGAGTWLELELSLGSYSGGAPDSTM
ncbi:hypothetical protein ACLOJK_000782 [Asimina triloba]